MMNQLTIYPVDSTRWIDLEALFGPRGACGGCWCMYWRLKRSDYEAQKGEPNRLSLKAIIDSGETPGLLAYDGDKAVGWVSLAPRQEFSTLERSRILKPVDDQPVWSVVCFFVTRSHRRKGVGLRLLQGAVEYAAQNGAKILEGYPVEPKQGASPDPFVFTGLASTFRRAGFQEVLRRSDTRPVMRYFIQPSGF